MKAGCLVLLACALAAAPAQAQMTWTDRAFVNVNFGVQEISRTLNTASEFDLYEETGRLSTTQPIDGGALFDLGAGYKVWRNLAVGLGYSRFQSDADVAISASVPDPNFFDRPREVSGIASNARHSEHAVHLQGTWIMPVTDTVDVGFSFGPTIFKVSQDVATAITVTEPAATIASTTVVRENKTAVGLHLGIDVNYFFTPRFGAGMLARFAWGSTDLDSSDENLKLGGFQIGGGLRVRF
jgi:hypothetical protein